MKQPARKHPVPKASRPAMPDYGLEKSKKGLLPWKWAADRLARSRQYWIATSRPDGSPHVMIVWGLWWNQAFHFSTGKTSRKARNLAANPRCVICSEDAAQAVIVEGVVGTASAADLKALFAAYKKKYKCDLSGMDEPLYRVEPHTVFGQIEKKFTKTATRWRFT
jgi:hypothetical protein